MSKQTARLEKWSEVKFGRMHFLRGDVFGHPNFEDGTRVHTSQIRAHEKPMEQGALVETNNTIYTLGAKE